VIDLLEGTVPECAWRDWGNPQKPQSH